MRLHRQRIALTSHVLPIALLGMSFLGAGCSWGLHARAPRPGEELHLESILVTPPAGEGWRAARAPDRDRPRFVLEHAGPGGAVDRAIEIVETAGTARPASPDAALHRLTIAMLSDIVGPREEFPIAVPERLGSVEVASRVRVTGNPVPDHAGERRVVETVEVVFTPATATDRTITLTAAASGTTGDLPRLDETIGQLLDGVQLRPVDAASRRDAARDHGFPKQFEPGLSGRSLTLPRGGLQWEVFRERWTSRKDFTGTWGLAYGLTDHLELSTPGFVRYAFGEADARTRPELAVGAGFAGLERDAARGTVWGCGLSLEARQRLSRSATVHAALFGERLQESRTRRRRLGGAGVAGVVYDPRPMLSVNLEAGYSSRWWSSESHGLVWIGGRSTPLLTLHLPLLDVGLVTAAAWDEGKPGLLAGFSTLVTF